MYAARQNAADATAALIALGAKLDEQDGDGTTALSLAIMNQHYDLAATLLAAGADPKVADRTGTDALFVAVEMVSFRSDVGRPPRPSLDKLKATDIVRLALEHGANPDARLVKPGIGRHHAFSDNSLGEGATPLMKAAKAGDLETMRMLLVAGADPSLKMAKGSVTVFDIAAGKVSTGAALVGGRGTKGTANEAMQNLLKEFAANTR
jgi:ankyrin repeat protein